MSGEREVIDRFCLAVNRVDGLYGIAAQKTGISENRMALMSALFYGYSMGSVPVISYQCGAQDHDELQNLLRKSLILTVVTAVAITMLSALVSESITGIFVSYDAELWDIMAHGFQLYVICFLLCGFNVFASWFFTALNNGLVTAIISFARALVFQVVAVVLLPALLGLDGIWLAITLAELLSIGMSAVRFVAQRGKYHYA